MKKVLSIAIAVLFSVSGLSMAQSFKEGDETMILEPVMVKLMNLEEVWNASHQSFGYGKVCMIHGRVTVEAPVYEEDKEILVRYNTSLSTRDECPSKVIFYLSKEYFGKTIEQEKKSALGDKNQAQIAGILETEKH